MTTLDLEHDARRDKRIRTLKSGCVYFYDGRSAINCTIRDITNEGAQLVFEHQCSVPDRIELQIGHGDFIEARVGCQVRWRRDKQIGVYFDESQIVRPRIL